MDRLEEIWQRTEAAAKSKDAEFDLAIHAPEDIPYLLSEVDRLNDLHKREIIVTGEYAQRVIDLTARAEKAEAERDAYRAALEALHISTDLLKGE